MKTLIMIAACLVFATASQAQLFNSSHVPEAAKVSFRQQYPKAKHITWIKDEQGYQAKFDLHHNTFFAIYDEKGNTLAEVMTINKVKLPRRAKRQLHNSYTSYAVEGAVRIRSIDGRVIFGAHIGREEEALNLTFNESGYVLTIIPDTE